MVSCKVFSVFEIFQHHSRNFLTLIRESWQNSKRGTFVERVFWRKNPKRSIASICSCLCDGKIFIPESMLADGPKNSRKHHLQLRIGLLKIKNRSKLFIRKIFVRHQAALDRIFWKFCDVDLNGRIPLKS